MLRSSDLIDLVHSSCYTLSCVIKKNNSIALNSCVIKKIHSIALRLNITLEDWSQ
jgi:hypothetical protein